MGDIGNLCRRRLERRRGQRHGVGAEAGLRMHALAQVDGLFEEVRERDAAGARLLCALLRPLHLAEDLRLAQHLGVERADHAEGVLHRLLAAVEVEHVLVEARAQPLPEEGLGGLRAQTVGLGVQEELDAIAGAERRGLLDAVRLQQGAEGLRIVRMGARRPADVDGRRLVVCPHAYQAHWAPLLTCGCCASGSCASVSCTCGSCTSGSTICA